MRNLEVLSEFVIARLRAKQCLSFKSTFNILSASC